MAASAIGVIFSNLHEETVPELVRRRTMASIPFGGRYGGGSNRPGGRRHSVSGHPAGHKPGATTARPRHSA